MISPQFRQEVEQRRQRVRQALDGGALVVFSAPVHRRNGDVEHPYRASSDMVYLSGFEEPESVVVLRPTEPHYVLFVRPRDPEKEIWDGRRAGVEGATKHFGADVAHPITELDSKLPDYLEGLSSVHYFFGEEPSWDRTIFSALKRIGARRQKRVSAPSRLTNAGDILHSLRQLKSEYEVERMREVCELSARAHNAAMAACRPEMNEFELQNVLEAVFREGGARRQAYESIVGSGPNATILHYRDNDRTMQEGELVLIDAGAELAFYAADITRTFPVSGTFSAEQKQLYELVLTAQQRAIEASQPGKTLDDVHDAAFGVIEQGLIDLGLVSADVLKAEEDERKKATRKYFMHRTSHFLGMDVHDVGRFHREGRLLPLEEGMIITVEPGLYVAEDDESVPEPYRGIGIRIEDDVLVRRGGPEVLTAAAVKTLEDVERLCRAGDDRGFARKGS